jgi:hypothetical protein
MLYDKYTRCCGSPSTFFGGTYQDIIILNTKGQSTCHLLRSLCLFGVLWVLILSMLNKQGSPILKMIGRQGGIGTGLWIPLLTIRAQWIADP